jgi:hypothetical protein
MNRFWQAPGRREIMLSGIKFKELKSMSVTEVRRVESSEQDWRRRIHGWEQSGLSQREFCSRHRLSLSTFTLWRRRLRAGTGLAVAGPAPFPVPVEIVPLPGGHRLQADPLVLVLSGGQFRLEIPDGFRAETLRDVIIALEGQR